MAQSSTAAAQFPSGITQLDKPLEGGIPAGSLTLIDGQSKAGKSVLSQQLCFGALVADTGAAYYTTEHTVTGLVAQMESLQLDVTDEFLIDQLRIYPLAVPPKGVDSGATLARLVSHFDSLPESFGFIVVDTVTDLVARSQASSIIDFFAECKSLCDRGKTICVVAHSYAFDEAMLNRMRLLCDAHLRLALEEVGGKLAITLEVTKVLNAERTRDNTVSFVVDPNIGLKLLPFTKTRV